MNEKHIALARRAVACKGWRWMPGMRWWTEDDHGEEDDHGRLDGFQPEYMGHPADALPDLSDHATLGCLLALVREAWGMPTGIIVRYNDTRRWLVSWAGATHGGECGFGDTEAEALVAALEAAPVAGSVR